MLLASDRSYERTEYLVNLVHLSLGRNFDWLKMPATHCYPDCDLGARFKRVGYRFDKIPWKRDLMNPVIVRIFWRAKDNLITFLWLGLRVKCCSPNGCSCQVLIIGILHKTQQRFRRIMSAFNSEAVFHDSFFLLKLINHIKG